MVPRGFRRDGDVHAELNSELQESGELVETRGLSAPVHARRVKLRQGAPVVTDGPYAESQEVLAREPAVAVRGDTGKPAGWLITVAGRRLVDLLRSEQAPEPGWRMIGSARVRRRSACHHA